MLPPGSFVTLLLASWCATTTPCRSEPAARTTPKSELVIHELHPGTRYEVTLGDRVIFKTDLALEVDKPWWKRKTPGIRPYILGSFAGVSPYAETIVLGWFDWGNACDTHGFSFIGIKRDGSFRIANVTTCTQQEPSLSKAGQRIVLVVPPEPPGIRHGGPNPLVPGEEWVFERGLLRRLRKIRHLPPSQQAFH